MQAEDYEAAAGFVQRFLQSEAELAQGQVDPEATQNQTQQQVGSTGMSIPAVGANIPGLSSPICRQCGRFGSSGSQHDICRSVRHTGREQGACVLAWQGGARHCLQVPALLRPSLDPLQVLQKARLKLQKVAKEGMAAAVIKQDHAGVLRFSALFPPLGYQVGRPSLTASSAWPFTLC